MLVVDGSGNYTVKLLVNPDVVSHLVTFTRVITFMSEFCVSIEVTSFLLFSCSAITASQRERPFSCNDYSLEVSVRRVAFWSL